MSKTEIVDTRITDQWGVKWSPMEIIRDFLQNFYDENPVERINIAFSGDVVTVSAPAEFDYEELLYMGSDKGEDKIGKYGEGFKAATLNILRDHHCHVTVTVKDKKLDFYFEHKQIGKSEKKVVMCKVSSVESSRGTKLIISNCPSMIIEEFRFGLNCFYYKNNPLFGDIIAKTFEEDVFIIKSKDKSGYVFYKKLLRARLDIPLIFVCNRQYKSIEVKIMHDRDRKAFNDEVLDKFLCLVSRLFNHKEVTNIVNCLEPWWEKGHKVLSALADSLRRSFKMEFPENYYAKSSNIRRCNNIDMICKIQLQEEEFNRLGYNACPYYMSSFGMKTAEAVIREREARIKKKYEETHTRNTTPLEDKALSILKQAIDKLNHNLTASFKNAKYTIGDADEILGELKENRPWNEQHVYLSDKFFTFDFSDAIAILLHEWGHIRGYDGSRSFTDALTEFISVIIKNRNTLDAHEKEWGEISLQIKRQNSTSTLYVYEYVESLTSPQKSQLFKSMTEEELLALLEKTNLLQNTDNRKEMMNKL